VQLEQIRTDLQVVPVSGDIEGPIALFNAGQIDALVVELIALKQLELSFLVAEILPFKTHPLQGSTVVVAKENNAFLKSLFHVIDIRRNLGKVNFALFSLCREEYLPVQSVKALKRAEVIFFEEGSNQAFLNNFKCKKVNMGGKTPEEVQELLYQAALEGRQVVKLVSDTVEGLSGVVRDKEFLRKRLVHLEILPVQVTEATEATKKRRNQILVTGNNPVRYEYLGEVVHTPLVESLPLKDYSSFLDTLPSKNEFDWILFTSNHAVRYFFQALTDNEIDIRWLAGSKIISIGPATTRELKANRILCDLESEKDSVSGIIDLFQERNLLGRKILLPGPEGIFNSLQGYFEKAGYQVLSLPVFRNHSPQILKTVDLKEIDIVVFSSPSAVRNFKSLYKEFPEHAKVISTDETTTRELYIAGILEYSDWVI
jgi:uroporphyrinogen-III synthase